MLVAYLDETYLKGVEHALIALVLPASKISQLERDLNAVVEKACAQHSGIEESAELHGYELSSGEQSWESLKSPRTRARIYKEAVTVISSVEGAAFCRGSVDLASKKPDDPHKWALTIALECVDNYASRTGDAVIGICDDVGNKSIYQAMYADARKNGTGGHYPKNLDAFTDGLHFTPSCHSRPIQAVDMLAYVYRRTHIKKFGDERAAKVMNECWDIMQPLRDAGFYRTW
ncbi:DUF3800 domain-containing protein [Corynebacterium sp. H113]|uniref:DUF3800 domain-containing protein n=1 Tax=Corynebacterium sp. H113 TaxID=3133419 RepID=UPI0030AD0A3A